jgi:hypothetical protein
VKYCSLLKGQSAPAPIAAYTKPVKATKSTAQKNIFLVLGNESDDESTAPVAAAVVKQELTAPQPVQVVTNQKPVLNYSKIIEKVNNPETYAKAKAEELRIKLETEKNTERIAWAKAEAQRELDEKQVREARDARIKAYLNKPKTSWATAESSDEEDEEEEDTFVWNKSAGGAAIMEDNSAW